MKITTTARHYELTPALKDYAEKKILNLDKYSEQIDTAHATFSLEKYRHVVEIAVHLNGKEFNGTEESEDMYASIDKAVDKIERQLLKHKGKIKKRKSNKKIAEMDYEFPDAAAPAAGASAPAGPAVVPSDADEFPVSTIKDALAEMAGDGREFSIFRDNETNKLTVLFVKKDGTFGLLEV
jgi:putative sigma-54 modulation protein